MHWPPPPPRHASQARLLLVAATEGGEGGEAGNARAGGAESLAALGYIEGHPKVGVALYEAAIIDGTIAAAPMANLLRMWADG